jgi:replicative DNA helicase
MDIEEFINSIEVPVQETVEDTPKVIEQALHERVIDNIKIWKQKILDGGVNCIPLGLPRFEEEMPGIEQKCYIQITANTKVGKTQITDYLLLYNPILYAMENPDKIRVKIFYFTLEMSKEQKELQMMSHLLWRVSQGRIRVSPKELRSVSAEQPLEDEIIEMLESDEYKEYFQFFDNHVEFIDSIRNPFGIYKFMREYAQANGIQHTKIIEKTDKATGEIKETVVDDYYEPYDPDEYVIIIVDHMALLTAENGKNVRDAMIKLSSDYFVTLRNKYRYIPVAVVQQAMAQESNENYKLNKLKPTLDGYGDAKVIARDADVILGLFSPYRHSLREYEGYNIEHFKDNIRFMELIAGREGGGGSVCPLYFDGAVNYFKELPLPKDKEGMEMAYRMLKRIREKGRMFFIFSSIKNKIKDIFNK